MLSAEDDAIGRVIEKLAAAGLEEQTLIFFLSDNGGPVMRGTTINGSNNTPLRGSKRTTLEGGVRVPWVASWKGHLPAGKVYDQPVIQLDILPTALAAAGIEPPGSSEPRLDGLDLLPYLRGDNASAPHPTLFWRFGEQMAIRQGDWKLVRYDAAADGEPTRKQGRKGAAATDAKLYDLATDIGESRDLASKHPEKVAELQSAWDAWNAQLMPPLWGAGGGKQAASD